MKVLVINCGSSSLKYQVLDMTNETLLAKGLVERIGIEGSIISHEKIGMDKFKLTTPMETHKDAIKHVLDALMDPEHGVVTSMDEIGAVGHRVVHAGEKYASSVLINEDVINALEECVELAPLHNPPNLLGIAACQELMPTTPMVGVFDTAFHQTMPPESYIYAIPYEYYEKYGIRRYGFHGTSHKYVAERTADILGVNIKDLKIITCHLGNGASVSAIKRGVCIDTSMGFTPLEGLVMGTRSGDIDPAIVSFIRQKENLPAGESTNILNKKSGVLGISGVSSDFRDLEVAVAEGNERAALALKVFAHKVRFYIGAYIAEMNGVDAIVFTAGVGENDINMRDVICSELGNLGIKLDLVKNKVRGKETIISREDSKVKILLIPTNEELMIARDTFNIVKGL
ncbi:acetate/propionate family kinase [Sinanaerobacter chloroacetimidivorans]|uniref:Acetate kinase n=1 Tax=Sinanaerobacter chloroacetimidivorans TaxID=2818044 RepID=A0A8J7VWV6_9FIRM|nr:acetate kinase [Sinanaerobacter chloroacetimidivorans]MBR0596537.1 acetate kinase [Sinanaerobacter chloroacetimidivorans]